MSDQKERADANIPVDSRPAILVGVAIIAVGVLGFGTWAATAELSSAVLAPGVVTVDSNRKAVQHLEGGIVKEILVRDGDAVQAGQVLVRLDETRARASLAILQGSLDVAQAVEARLLAERGNADNITYPRNLMTRTSDANVAELLRGQEQLFTARRDSLLGETEIYRQRIAQVEEQILGLEAQRRAKERQAELIKEELDGLLTLMRKGFAEKNKVLALEREMARLEGERGELIASTAEAKESISEAKLQIIQLEKTFREAIEQELRDTRAEAFDLVERANAARFTLDQMEVRAPENGIVVGLEVHNEGAIVQPGATILEIVPSGDDLIVEARVRPHDIDNVSLGLEADVHFTAFPQRTTPTLVGEVVYYSADSVEDPKSDQAYFVARVAVSEAEVERLGERQLRPGMPADIMIKTGARTALDYLMQPLSDTVQRAWLED